MARIRGLDLEKPPGIAETVDWVAALTLLGVARLDESSELAATTLGSVLKNRDDLDLVRARGAGWLTGVSRG